MLKTIKPSALKKGDVIGIVAPASSPNPLEKIDRGVRYLESLGYRVELGKHVRDVRGDLAGTDEARAEDFNAMVRRKDIRAIFAVRGGYGTPRILDRIDYAALRRNPKIVVGYSDLTALQLAIFKRTGLLTFSGPMVAVEMQGEIDPFTEENFWRMLTSSKRVGQLKNPIDVPLEVLYPGVARGVLIGGNLSLLVSLLGTRYFPAFSDSVLVIEEVEEEPYRVDRMFAQLRHARVFSAAKGILLGAFTDCVPHDPQTPHLALNEIFADYFSTLGKPVIANLAYGHIPRKLTLPLGAQVQIRTRRKVAVEILEPVVSG